MRVLVCGGRDFSDRHTLYKNLDVQRELCGFDLLIEGGATGADQLAKDWAHERGVEVLTFPADWKAFGHSAGPIRNRLMVYEGKPDWVIAFPGGRGTAGMLRIARHACVPVWEPR